MVSKRIVVSPEDRLKLERIVRSRRAERRMVERAEGGVDDPRVGLGEKDGQSAPTASRKAPCSFPAPPDQTATRSSDPPPAAGPYALMPSGARHERHPNHTTLLT